MGPVRRLTPTALAVFTGSRDRLREDLRRIDAGEIGGFSPQQLTALRERLAHLNDILRNHGGKLH